MKQYVAVIERCTDTGYYVGYVPGFPGAHSQADSLDELHTNLQEVISMLLEDGEPELEAEFICFVRTPVTFRHRNAGIYSSYKHGGFRKNLS